MRLLQVLALSPLFLSPAYSQGLLSRLDEVGLDGFSNMLAVYNPTLVEDIGKRNDITVWAPGNALVTALLAKRQEGNDTDANGARTSAQVDAQPSPPQNVIPSKRQVRQGPPGYPDTNFQTIITFLQDPQYVNLGPNQPARFTKNYGVPLDEGSATPPSIDVVTGLGDTQFTLRGPFKFTNGVIYEINQFFSLPQPFTTTMEHINLAQNFYNTVVSSSQLSIFEETPAITVFAPIDSSYTNAACDPDAYILTGPSSLYYSPYLIPGNNITTRSGRVINITAAPDGGRLVNGRSLVKPNVPMKNGVIHFIDGPLFASEGCHSTTPPPPPRNSTTQTGPPPTQTGAAASHGYAASALVLAFAASLLAFY